MGRKKRKVADDVAEAVPSVPVPPENVSLPQPPPPSAVVEAFDTKKDPKQGSSGYAMTTHSAEIVEEDIYVSDGSEDEEEVNEIEMVLAGSRMGVMRRGIHHPMLVQPNRQWTRKDQETEENGEGDEESEQKRLKEQEEELAKLDPAQRAARLLAEKQRKLDEAKETARRLESEENAGRDPCLFSKRTAFDIRFDQIDDKPWARGAGDLTDFFNYGMGEEDWLDYAQQQLMIRQELTDAGRQRRPVDPTIVPVTPKTPNKQTPKVAVAESTNNDTEKQLEVLDASNESGPVIGPAIVKREGENAAKDKTEGPDKGDTKFTDIHVGSGGAWGAGAAPGSVLAKLIEEQERQQNAGTDDADTPPNHKDEDSIYGPGAGNNGNREWNNQDSYSDQDWNNQGHSSQKQHDWNNQGHGGQQDWNDRGSYGQQQQWNQHKSTHRGGRGGGGGGRGYYGGRGGRGGRGSYNNDYRGRGGRDQSYQSRGGGSDHQQRKRPREDYDNRWRR